MSDMVDNRKYHSSLVYVDVHLAETVVERKLRVSQTVSRFLHKPANKFDPSQIKYIDLKGRPTANHDINAYLKIFRQFIEILAEQGVEIRIDVKSNAVKSVIKQFIKALKQLHHIFRKHQVIFPKNENINLGAELLHRCQEHLHQLLSFRRKSFF